MSLDIGGANIKVAELEHYSADSFRFSCSSHVFPMWQRASELAQFLKSNCAADPSCCVAVTLTAELADIFPTKRDGVNSVLNAVRDAFSSPHLQVLTSSGELISIERALENPLQVAGANWAASAWTAAQIFPEGILGDTGSTTTDLIPFDNGRIRAIGKTDPKRLLSGELVYTGCLRTPCAHLAPRVPWRGEYCRVSPEYFTIVGDVHLLLGNIQPGDYQWPTPDGRGTSPHELKARIARLICGDTEMLSDEEIMTIAQYLYQNQIEQVADALREILLRMQRSVPLICAGSGRFLLKAAASRVGVRSIDVAEICGEEQSKVFPAWSLCMMLAAQQEGIEIFEQFRAPH
jgi:hypothetical protein